MSGKILIIDDLATNRIVLKVKLSNTPYRIEQAGSAREALRLAVAEPPDIILSSACLGGHSAEGLIRALRRISGLARVPILLIQGEDCATERLSALRAGADEVLSRPVPEPLLLARLRNLLRQRNAEEELIDQGGGAGGFAEVQADLNMPGRVAVFGNGRVDALALRARIADTTPHRITCRTLDDNGPPSEPQDIFVIRIAMEQAEPGLRLLADLKSSPGTRDCPVIVLLKSDAADLAVTLLDMGADDVRTAPVERQELGHRIGRHLARKRRHERLRAQLRSGLEASLRDPLTGAYNRRYALPWLEQRVARLALSRKCLAVMIADLDFFKNVNDLHGHAAGDAVLVTVTDRLRVHLREGDLLARIGGEEFLIVLHDTSPAEAHDVAERLCEAIRHTPVQIPCTAEPVPVTLSIGVTVAQPRPGLSAPSMQALLEEADRALYAAKAQGRDQASFCTRSAA